MDVGAEVDVIEVKEVVERVDVGVGVDVIEVEVLTRQEQALDIRWYCVSLPLKYVFRKIAA